MVHVEVQGVGYEVNISLNTYSQIQDKDQGLLHTYLQVREDAHVLYGFYDLAEKQLFMQLIGVTGIGAGTARMMLSSQQPEEITRAIVQGEVKLLERIKGIGKKTAERIVLELKDKLAKAASTTNFSAGISNSLGQDALNALIALGIARSVAEPVVKKVLSADPSASLESLIKKSLQSI
jgi:Holliday junction DNA helicase RuvA